MPRAARPWFRFYVEAFNDRKLLRLTPTQRWIWVAVLGAARESPVPGTLLIADGVPMTRLELARYADVRERDIDAALDVMEGLGMVDQGDPVTVTNWSERQYESDNTTERTRKHRSKEQVRNVPTTPVGTDQIQRQKTEEISRVSDADFDDWWSSWPRKVDKAEARAKYRARRKSGVSHEDLCRARDNYVRTIEDARFCKHGATFLAPETWREWLNPPADLTKRRNGRTNFDVLAGQS